MRFNALTRSLTLSLAALGLSALMHNAHAQSIGINFTAGGQLLAPTDQPGVVPGANWNNAVGTSGTVAALNDSTGTPTTAQVTFSSTNGYDVGVLLNTPNAATNRLYAGALTGNNLFGEVVVTVANIPYASYSVYSYAIGGDASASHTLSITNGTTTYYYISDGNIASGTSLTQTTSTDPNNPTSGEAQYQVFSGLTGSSFTLTTGGSINNILSNNIFGLQIVVPAGTPVPEPGSVALLIGAGIGGLMLKRRRK